MADKQHIFKGSGAPVSAPTEVGHHYVDLTNNQMYFSTDILSASDWTLLGSGGGGTWGSITGTLSAQTDLQTALNAKQATITGAASTVVSSNLTVDRLVVSNGSGKLDIVNVTTTEAGYLAGATSNIQTQLNNKQDELDGNVGNNSVLGTNGSGIVQAISGLNVNPYNGLQQNLTYEPDDLTGGFSINTKNLNVEPLQDSPDESVTLQAFSIDLDTNDSGFGIGTTGMAARMQTFSFNHQGESDIGEINFVDRNFTLGNGTDPISVRGFSYAYGFGTVNAGVTITNAIQGYGFQPSINASATLGASSYTSVFYDFANYGCASNGYTSFNSSPIIASITSTNNYIGFNSNPTIPVISSNAGVMGISIGGTLGTFGANSYFTGINVNPTITSSRFAAGINVTMDNVTPYAGVKASVTIQDLTFEFIQPGSFNNSYTIEFVDDGTAGSETVTIAGQTIEIHIEAGVSTATQVKTACDANSGFASNVTTTISGTAGDAQVAEGPTNFSGGIDAGRVLAAYLDGDVEITGSLTFGGALSIGKLNAFHTQALVDGGGTPTSIHSLITAPTVGDNVTLTSGDSISVNTAALITIGTNSTVGTSFIGVAALGLPAVLNMGTGSTIDRLYASLFALSLDASAAGGTVDEMGLCRAVAIPNGATTVNNLYGFLFDLPFGDPGTKTFGFYDRPGKNNYFAGNLLIGGSPGSDDLVENGSVALEINSTTKAFLNARMTTSERNALTAVNGMQIYNTTDDKLQVYAAGVWVDLH